MPVRKTGDLKSELPEGIHHPLTKYDLMDMADHLDQTARKHSPEDLDILAVSNMMRKAAYGEDEPKQYPFAGLQIWLSGASFGAFVTWLLMR